MKEIVIFGGTTEGRKLAEQLASQNFSVDYCVATEYGEAVVLKNSFIKIHQGRMAQEQIEAFLKNGRYEAIIDATHPYAVEVSGHLRAAAACLGKEVLRLKREESAPVSYDRIVEVDSVKEAASYAKNTNGKIFLSTGSKELQSFLSLLQAPERVIARILPDGKMIDTCLQAGIPGKQIIAMQGPFSEQMNVEMFRQTDAKILITKDGGKTGGYGEKIAAARQLGMQVIVLKRPEEEGLSYEQVLKRVGGYQPETKQIFLAGIGMGDPFSRTLRVDEVIKKADLVIGAGRMLSSVDTTGKTVYNAYLAEDICGYLEQHVFQTAVILFSGDSGFYSGAKKLRQEIEKRETLKHLKTELLPGISSVSYFASKLGVSYENCALLSIHGRSFDYVNRIKNGAEQGYFMLLSNGEQVLSVAKTLRFYDVKLSMALGRDLGSADELVIEGSVEEFANEAVDCKKSGSYLLYLEKEEKQKPIVTGLSDTSFLREKVPMTKEEIRAVCIAKLKLCVDSVLVDVGAGTGSVAIEAARMLQQGKVFGIEKNKEAIQLIEKNKKLHGVDNLTVLEGIAPDRFSELPRLSHAFIGGSNGKLSQIVDRLLINNPNIRIVVTAITIETIAELESLLHRDWKEKELVQISAAKTKELGSYHLMMGQNPVWIGCFCGVKNRSETVR